MEFDPNSEVSNSAISPHSSDAPRISDAPEYGDITTIALGEGWSPVAVDANGSYRLAANGAVIGLPPRIDSTFVLTLDAEPQPAGTPVVVTILSSSDAPIVTSSVVVRRSLRAVLPLLRSDLSAVRLMIAATNGTLEATLCVRSIELDELPGDIIGARSALMLGSHGWADLEFFGGEFFRWVDNDAEVHFLDAFSGTKLTFDISPGHSVIDDRMDLIIFDDRGHRLAAVGVAERSRIEVTVDARATRGIRLHVANGGAPLAGDPRILNMRVFGVRISGP